jgi:hypothetical protein
MTGWACPAEPAPGPERLGPLDFLAVLALPWLNPHHGQVTGGPCVTETEPEAS